jgi:hypothetical protein
MYGISYELEGAMNFVGSQVRLSALPACLSVCLCLSVCVSDCHCLSVSVYLPLPTTVSKETYYSVKRDLLQCQKRPTTCHCLSVSVYLPLRIYLCKRDLL